MKRYNRLLPALLCLLLCSSCTNQKSDAIPEFEIIREKIESYLNEYHSLSFDGKIISAEKEWQKKTSEGGAAFRYTANSNVIRYEIVLLHETGQRVVNIHMLDDGIYIVDLRQIYDIPMVTEIKSVLDYELRKFILLNDVLYLYGENNNTLTKSTDEEQSYLDLIHEAESLFEMQ